MVGRVVKKTRQTPARTICLDSSRMSALHCNSPEHFDYLSVHLLYLHSSAVQVAQVGWSLSWLSDIMYTKTEHRNSFVGNSSRLMFNFEIFTLNDNAIFAHSKLHVKISANYFLSNHHAHSNIKFLHQNFLK